MQIELHRVMPKGMSDAESTHSLVLVSFFLLLAACKASEGGPAGRACSYDGSVYPDRTSWWAADGCNECTCLSGAVSCTGSSCDASVPNPPCIYDGASYPFGASFPSIDGCNICECSWRWYHDVNPGPAEVACSLNACSGSSVSVARPDSDASFSDCVYNGTTYPADARFPSADGCDECHCRTDGQVTCTFDHIGCPAKAALTCNLSDGRQVPAGAVYNDGCNCCVCLATGRVCEGAGCLIPDGGVGDIRCQSDSDCAAALSSAAVCIFDQGCSPGIGTCSHTPICPLFGGPYAQDYCGCDGQTFHVGIAGAKQYPDRPYSHLGGCL